MTFAECNIEVNEHEVCEAPACLKRVQNSSALDAEDAQRLDIQQTESLDELSDVCDDELMHSMMTPAAGKDGGDTLAALAQNGDDQCSDDDGSQCDLNMCHIDTFPAQREEHKGKYTVVFDLDETLVYARDGTIRPRPHVNELLKLIEDRCEVVIWTAGVRAYAHRVITAIDSDRVIKDCICRHDAWFQNPNGHSYVKDLKNLNRDLSRTIIIENTPDCVVRNPLNSIIVSDYISKNPLDTTLNVIAQVLDGLIDSDMDVPNYLASHPLLRLETLKNATGDTLGVFMLK